MKLIIDPVATKKRQIYILSLFFILYPSYAPFTQDASVLFLDDLWIGCIDLLLGEDKGKAGRHYLKAIGQGLKLTITALFTGRAEMVSRYEQQFNDFFTDFVKFFGVVLDFHPFMYR